MPTISDDTVLDLHGCTKEKALSKLAFFLDRHKQLHKHTSPDNGTVEIITGSGKHSPHGPVLRQAVEKVLIQRQITFQLNRGKGSFTVDAFSCDDTELPVRYPTDTKVVIVEPKNRQKDVKLVNRPKNCAVANNNQKSSPSASEIASEPMPTPGEIMQDEKQLQNAKQLSIQEASQQASVRTKERNQLEQTIEKSIEDREREEEEESKALREALELSQKEQKERQSTYEEENKTLRDTLELSRKEQEENSCTYDEDAMLEMALKLSQEQK